MPVLKKTVNKAKSVAKKAVKRAHAAVARATHSRILLRLKTVGALH